MGSDLFLAWSDHWDELLRMQEREWEFDLKLTHIREAMRSGLFRMEKRLGVKGPLSPEVNHPTLVRMREHLYAVCHKYESILEVSYEESDELDEKYVKTEFNENLDVLGPLDDKPKKDYGYILRGYSFVTDFDIHDIFDIIGYYNPQDWSLVAKRIDDMMNSSKYAIDSWSLKNARTMCAKILTKSNPNQYCVCHSW